MDTYKIIKEFNKKEIKMNDADIAIFIIVIIIALICIGYGTYLFLKTNRDQTDVNWAIGFIIVGVTIIILYALLG